MAKRLCKLVLLRFRLVHPDEIWEASVRLQAAHALQHHDEVTRSTWVNLTSSLARYVCSMHGLPSLRHYNREEQIE